MERSESPSRDTAIFQRSARLNGAMNSYARSFSVYDGFAITAALCSISSAAKPSCTERTNLLTVRHVPSASSRGVCPSRFTRRVGHDQGVPVSDRVPPLRKRADRQYGGRSRCQRNKMSQVPNAAPRRRASTHNFLCNLSFRSGGAVSRALAGDSTSIVMQRALRENPRMALRYIPLVEVSRSIPRCGEGDVMVEGISQTSTGSSATCLGASRAGRGQPSKTARCLEQDHNW